ncbi:DUF397 domain-containing protein [Streptomyces angustmyceticus]|uniref:DUF397 domain-containing protein n=1 Tax=Streptomyces angustmyceticus TaxID=285578 RepID=UPI000A3AA3E8|nr:DUF397 domain-containing protein [Streptomyces angustmyceticus]UAL67420.1 DUF397 domain-containing protein [Streptomyces angustmyceticus]
MNTRQWIRSSYCDSAGLDCIEVATCAYPLPSVWVRDSKIQAGPPIVVPPSAWSRFIDAIEHLDRTSST